MRSVWVCSLLFLAGGPAAGCVDYGSSEPDGTCSKPADCQGLEHAACQGHFDCLQGACDWVCDSGAECDRDADCVKVPGDCCGCEWGGVEAAVPADEEQAYLAEREEQCAVVDVDCGGHLACTDRPAVCRQGRCELLGQDCGCPADYSDWDPVCIEAPEGGRWTLPTACLADCLELAVDYPGRCDCAVDCDQADPVCAANGVTYWCGQMEADCNGQAVVYRGECAPACDLCLQMERPWMQVCAEDFQTWPDTCLLECHGLDWWHAGECEPGEGATCGGIMGLVCDSPELSCLVDPNVPDAQGVCVLGGHCQVAYHCAQQALTHDACSGQWSCTAHECAWVCD